MDHKKLATLCLEHVRAEECSLEATLQTLQEVRTHLVQGERSEMAEVLRKQDLLTTASQEVVQRRDSFRREAAKLTGVPADTVTLSNLAEVLPRDVGRQLALGRQRLREMASEVEQITRRNLALIRPCLEFFEGFFNELTGASPSPGCYGPRGRQLEATRGSFVHLRG